MTCGAQGEKWAWGPKETPITTTAVMPQPEALVGTHVEFSLFSPSKEY